ncbi:MAG: CRTAC1 family protein [Planctomycetes bacterium]|nr:CRTAC1 family protein [Planctomycetota bacterium]
MSRVFQVRQQAPAGIAVLLACLWGCTGEKEGASPPPAAKSAERPAEPGSPASALHFVEVAAAAGLTRFIWCGRPGKDHLLDSAGTGAAFLDYDRDGRLDLYLVNGWRLAGSAVAERGRNALYRGLPGGRFQDVTEAAGVAGEGRWGSGAFAADVDADGWTDLFITTFGSNLLYRNRGDGTFENAAGRLGVECPGWNTGAAFFDADGDRDLDLYIAAYIDCAIEEVLKAERTLDWKGIDKVAFGPFGLKGARDHFFLAGAEGKFTEAAEAGGLVDLALGFGFAVRAGDYDNDGDLDLYVANDSDANYLYRNEGQGKFTEVGLWSGCAFNAGGAAQASMGVAAGDPDGDNHLDLFVTHFSEDYSTFYRNLGGGFFDDVTAKVGLAEPTYRMLSWGAVLADLDNDGDQDLVVLNGHIYPQVDLHPEQGQAYKQRNQLFENRNGAFVEVTGQAGPGFRIVLSSRGLAAGDYDNDGDLDLLMTSLDAPPLLLRNDSRCGAWLTVQLEAPKGQSAIGSRVIVTAGGRRQIRDLAVGESYLSTHDPRLHFGLGGAERAEKIEVRWPDGSVSVRTDIPARQFISIHQGEN